MNLKTLGGVQPKTFSRRRGSSGELAGGGIDLRDGALNYTEILRLLASQPDPQAVAGMARFGIVAKKVYGGWSTPELKKLA